MRRIKPTAPLYRAVHLAECSRDILLQHWRYTHFRPQEEDFDSLENLTQLCLDLGELAIVLGHLLRQRQSGKPETLPLLMNETVRSWLI